MYSVTSCFESPTMYFLCDSCGIFECVCVSAGCIRFATSYVERSTRSHFATTNCRDLRCGADSQGREQCRSQRGAGMEFVWVSPDGENERRPESLPASCGNATSVEADGPAVGAILATHSNRRLARPQAEPRRILHRSPRWLRRRSWHAAQHRKHRVHPNSSLRL